MSAEDRVRTAAEATAASVRAIRPLTLPDSGAAAVPREHRGRTASPASRTLMRMKETWMIPLGAAAAVAALALSLVTLRHAEPRPPYQAPARAAATVAGIPRYYAFATDGPVSHTGPRPLDVTVADVRTGKALAVVSLPPAYGDGVIGLSAAADDRTFVVGRRDSWGNVGYFQVRIAPGAKPAATVRRLPIPLTSPGVLLGTAVSPDGRQLAALSVRGNGTTLRIYSVATGATLRTWIARTWRNQAYSELLPGVSWTADSRRVAFSTVVTSGQNPSGSRLVEREVSATAPAGALATVSKIVFKAPGNCSSLLLTPDGGTVVCATQVNYGTPTAKPAGCGGKYGPMFVAYSAATGKRLRVLYQYQGPCWAAQDTVLWSDASARHVIGEAHISFRPGSPGSTDSYGVAAGGKFVKFPVVKHGLLYTSPAF